MRHNSNLSLSKSHCKLQFTRAIITSNSCIPKKSRGTYLTMNLIFAINIWISSLGDNLSLSSHFVSAIIFFRFSCGSLDTWHCSFTVCLHTTHSEFSRPSTSYLNNSKLLINLFMRNMIVDQLWPCIELSVSPTTIQHRELSKTTTIATIAQSCHKFSDRPGAKPFHAVVVVCRSSRTICPDQFLACSEPKLFWLQSSTFEPKQYTIELILYY